jgi:3-hydroxybutyryl-CoA dehydratase
MTMPAFDRETLVPAEKLIDRAAIRLYAEITDDFNPIHLDPVFAAGTPMGGIIAHGMLSLNLIWQSLRETYGPDAAEGAELEVRFVKPVREGDVVRAQGLAVAGPRGRYEVSVCNQAGEAVIVGTLTLAQ